MAEKSLLQIEDDCFNLADKASSNKRVLGKNAMRDFFRKRAFKRQD